MRNYAKRLWLLAYLAGVSVFSGGIAYACVYHSNGTFFEDPSPYWGAWETEDCVQTHNLPRCGYYMCTSSICSSYSHVQGCTSATANDMWDYMLMGCRSEAGCGMY